MLTSGTIIQPSEQAAWLDERNSGIGASEAAAALGECPYVSPLELYLRKLGLADPVTPTIKMRLGNALEPFMAQFYQEETGRALRGQQVFYRDHDRGHVFATVDAVADDRVVEFKTTTGRNTELGDEDDAVPFNWLIQVQMQMHCSSYSQADLMVLVDQARVRFFHFKKSDELLGLILPGLDLFWGRVQAQEPPPDIKPSDAIARAYCAIEGAIKLDEPEATLTDRYQWLGEEIRAMEKEREAVKTSLLEALGPFDSALLPDGRLLSRKVVTSNIKAKEAHTRKSIMFRVKTPKE